jgi:hypothetical protein
MSGSSFLSSGDALVAAGIPRERIAFLCSRQPDIGSLHAPNAVERWPSFRAYYKSPTDFLPAEAKIYLGGGEWRHYMFSNEKEWPASWVSMERLKFLSPDLKTCFKFEGLGRFGRAAYECALACAEAGFSVPPGEFSHGFISYPMVQGQCLRGPMVERELLDRLARYCAFRFRAFTVPPDEEWRQLEIMLRFNVAEEFGLELNLPEAALRSAQPIIADARMLPHKWLRSRAGELIKVGAASHGDDHFFPGPTDIAWDLAGAVIEWELNPDAVHYLVSRYGALAGDHPELRLPHFLLAYSVFRMGYCKMAAEAMRGSGAEEHRLAQAYRRYRGYVACLLKAQLPVGAPATENITESLAEAV